MKTPRLTWVAESKRKICALNDLGHLVGLLSYEVHNSFTHWVWYQDGDEGLTSSVLGEVRSKIKSLYLRGQK